VSAIDELSRMPPPVPPPPSLALEAELGKLTAVAPRRPVRQLALLIGLSLIYGGGIASMLTLRRDLADLPMGWFAAAGLAWLVGFVAPVYLATVPAPGSIIPRWKLAGGAAVIGAIGFIALGLAIVPVVIGAVFLRGALPVGSRWVAASLGAGGGALGGLMLHVHCPITDTLHVGIIHGGVVGIAALVAAALVPRATDVR